MKICIVIQSDAFRNSAGMRIRYDRFAECIAEPGVTLEAVTCAELVVAEKLDHDVYIFCKTFDTAALLLARRVRAARKAVGQDLFDDYFSQYDDPRLQRYRNWMSEMAPVTDFAICSTPRMVDILRGYLPNVPITPIDDPVTGFDPILVSSIADAKVARARESRTLEVVWFGIGDNPYFRVGLSDLAACEEEFVRMQQLGWKIHLTIVTNRRAFEGGGAEALRGLSVGFDLVEWTEEAESEALEHATVAILPVSGQSFSRAKSLNRALTALRSGCQVLTVGYPLYERLDQFIYKSTEQLLADIESTGCRVSSTSVNALISRVSEVANPFEGAKAFVKQAREGLRIASALRTSVPLVCLLHGRKSKIDLHKLVQRMGGVSVRTIFTEAPWNFPVRFDLVDGAVAMRSTAAIAKRFGMPVADSKATITIGDFEFVDVDLAALEIQPMRIHLAPKSLIQDAVLYQDVFAFAARCCAAAFGAVDLIISDVSPLAACSRHRTQSHLHAEPGNVAALQPRRPGEPAQRPTGFFQRPTGLFQKLALRVARNVSAPETQEAMSLFRDCALFDRDWYLQTYRDVAANRFDPLRHYLEIGWREGRDPSPAFSSKLYLKDYPDVAKQGLNPLLHYIRFGQYEGRKVRPRIKSGLSDR